MKTLQNWILEVLVILLISYLMLSFLYHLVLVLTGI